MKITTSELHSIIAGLHEEVRLHQMCADYELTQDNMEGFWCEHSHAAQLLDLASRLHALANHGFAAGFVEVAAA